jgi:hypothetical protein
MTQLIYYNAGFAVCAFGVFVMLRRKDAIESVEWLKGYADKRMLPASKRVNFDSIASWFAFSAIMFIWVASGAFLVGDGALVVILIVGLAMDHLISKTSGTPRIKLTRYKSWALLGVSCALCAFRVWSLL